jgi:hypothetical protein
LEVNLSKTLAGQEIVRWNILLLKELGFYRRDVRDDPGFVPLLKMMAPVFPGGAIKNTVLIKPQIEKGSYLFKVSVSPGVWRQNPTFAPAYLA